MAEAAEKLEDTGADKAPEVVEEKSFDDMSDEEVSKLGPEELAALADKAAAAQSTEQSEDDGETSARKESASDDEPSSESDSEPEPQERNVADVYYSQGSEAEQEEVNAGEDTDVDEDGRTSQEQSLDYQQEYERLMAPFRAAKREIKLHSVDDARRLMQMGVDYARKMESLKPAMKAVKMLETNKLLDPDELNFLIDLHKGKKEAVAKFLKDRDIDPLDLSDEDAPDYRPTDYSPDDQVLALEEVITDIRDTDSFSKTMDEVQGKWDKASQAEVVKNPEILRVINDHVAVGIYDQIMNVVAQERTFGRLKGMSDLQAYKAVGDAIEAKGGFDPYKQGNQTANSGNQPSPGNVSQEASGSPGGASNRSAELRNRKRAASPTTGRKSQEKRLDDLDIMTMSEDDFSKLDPSIFT